MFCSFQELITNFQESRTSFQGNHNSQLSTLNSQLSNSASKQKKPRKFSLARLFKWRFKMDLNQRPPD